jgi:hypothetical protein
VLLGSLAYPVVGSGERCQGIGFGCTPERELYTLLVIAVYTIGAVATLVIAWKRDRRGLGFARALSVGTAITLAATGAAMWSQLPRYTVSPGSLSHARERWERVLADGRAVAPAGTALGNALRDLVVDGPRMCRDAYDRATGARTYRWSSPEGRNPYLGSGASTGAVTAAALDRWSTRLRSRGLNATVTDPGSDPASDRRLHVGPNGGAGGGNMYVRASFYISELEITAATGCHRG